MEFFHEDPEIFKNYLKVLYSSPQVFLAFPDSLRPAFPRLKDKLEDPDIGECIHPTVVCALCLILRFFL